MNQKPCQFYSFLQAVRGNWRNALFICCSGSLCPMIRQASCEGFLMATDAGCQPIFLSVQTVRKLSGEAVDPEECSAILECRFVPDCLYQVSGMAYLFGPCMSIFTAMPRPG